MSLEDEKKSEIQISLLLLQNFLFTILNIKKRKKCNHQKNLPFRDI